MDTSPSTPYKITVDGVVLDALAWHVESSKRSFPGVRASDTVAPGIHGVVPGHDESYDAGLYVLNMFVHGTNSAGVIVADTLAQFRENLDSLVHLFSKRYALTDLRETVNVGGTERQAMCRRLDAILPDIYIGKLGRFTVSFNIPAVFWQDVATSDWAGIVGAVTGTTQEVTTLAGSTAPIQDGTYLVVGPATNPTISDVASGRMVRLNQVLGAGSNWRVNSDTWSSRVGAGLGLGSADTTGTNAVATTDFSDQARMLTLNPMLVGAARKVQVSLSGTGFTAATALSVRARKKFL